MNVIDSHVHFWDPRVLDYPWLSEHDALRRPYGPDDLAASAQAVDGVVFVEAGCREDLAFEELAWVRRLANGSPPILGVVAQAPVERGDGAATDVALLASHPLVRGVRRNLQDEAAGFALAASFVDGVRLLADHDLTFDLCVRHHQLPEAAALVATVPEVSFVLDHLGKPPVAAGHLDPWRANLTRLARLPNVTCKLSGLATEADPAGWREEETLPFVRHALTEFGPDRCMFGSDWPVATLATTYPRWSQVVTAALADWPPPAHHAVFGGTARRVYRLED